MLVFAVLLAVVELVGCATGGKGSNPRDEIMAALDGYHAAMVAGDVERMVDVFSDDYSSADGNVKSAMAGMFQSWLDAGVFDGIEFDLSSCEITVDGNEATVGPVNYVMRLGTAGNRYTMRKEADGVWRIIYNEPL